MSICHEHNQDFTSRQGRDAFPIEITNTPSIEQIAVKDTAYETEGKRWIVQAAILSRRSGLRLIDANLTSYRTGILVLAVLFFSIKENLTLFQQIDESLLKEYETETMRRDQGRYLHLAKALSHMR